MIRGTAVTAACLLVAAGLLAGCRPGPDDEMVPRPTATHTVLVQSAVPLPRLPVGSAATDPGRRVRPDGGRIQLGGRTLDVSPLHVAVLVGTLGGAFLVADGRLWAAGGPSLRSLPFEQVHGLAVSADGRYLGLVDRNHGPGPAHGVRQALAVVYDTTTGRPVVRSSRGMGDRRADLARLYRARPPSALRFSGDTFVAHTPHGVERYPVR